MCVQPNYNIWHESPAYYIQKCVCVWISLIGRINSVFSRHWDRKWYNFGNNSLCGCKSHYSSVTFSVCWLGHGCKPRMGRVCDVTSNILLRIVCEIVFEAEWLCCDRPDDWLTAESKDNRIKWRQFIGIVALVRRPLYCFGSCRYRPLFSLIDNELWPYIIVPALLHYNYDNWLPVLGY